LARKGTADDLLAKRDSVGLSPTERGSYETARHSRDAFRTASAATLSASAGLLAIGGFLYLFDEPAATGVPVRFSPTRTDKPTPRTKASELSVAPTITPLVGPLWGLGATGSF
jgi:hypothetical protein